MFSKWRDKIFISPYCKVDEVKNIVYNKDPIIHDSTLREGEQTPGVVFTLEDRIKIAELLSDIGIDCIEVGFPASSKIEKNEIKRVVDLGFGPTIYGFARAVKSDIDAVIDCNCDGVVISFPPSDIHITHKLRTTREKYLEQATEIVEYSKRHGLSVIYSAEDSTRCELSWLLNVFKEVTDAGVDVLRVVDTIGCITPTAMHYLITKIRESFDKPIEVHCHNDHGLALANSLAAYENGVTRFSTSILGLGERAGIAATEELIVALNNFYEIDKYETERLSEICNVVADIAKIKIWPTKPIVGQNVFTHASGIHQDAVLKNPMVYECFPPEMVGQKRRFLLSRISGRAAVKAKLKEYRIEASDEDIEKITLKLKEVSANRRSALSDEEFLEMVKEYLSKDSKMLLPNNV
ncbi:MAG TPA: homoaconitate hydratase [Candidatus Bathyarchaeota archaeon]|nr:homoaconitate hydratase [Candidatus Bathyarchaeota archaeon]HEX69296.1 homoaconitate hydratase [Candidatus Bathyarchaeota archaeon]